MVKRSLKASEEGRIRAKKIFDRRQWSQEYLAAEVGLSTRNSIWKFFSGRPIERSIFMEICFKLDLFTINQAKNIVDSNNLYILLIKIIKNYLFKSYGYLLIFFFYLQ